MHCNRNDNFNNYGGYKNLNRSGRPIKTSSRDNWMTKHVHSLTSFKVHCLKRTQGQMFIPPQFLGVSDFSLKSYKPACKPRLTPLKKSKCLVFAKEYGVWTSRFTDNCSKTVVQIDNCLKNNIICSSLKIFHKHLFSFF